MKYICKHACIYKGVHTLPDTVIDVDEETARKNPIIGCSFVPLKPAAAAPAEDKPDELDFTMAQYREKLAAYGVQASPTATHDELRKLLNQHLSTKSRKSVK